MVIAASRLNSRPSWSLAYLIRRLSLIDERVAELHDTERELGRIFDLSYATLGFVEQKVFRLLSLLPAPEFDAHSAAAITGLPLARVERAIDDLIDSHLLQEPAPGRYRYHDLVMGFALSLENAEDSAAEKDQALGRLIDFSIHAVDRADRMIHPARPRLDVRPAASEIRLPGWRDRQEAESWLMTEHLALLATARYAMANGHPRRAAVLSHVMAGFLESGGFAA